MLLIDTSVWISVFRDRERCDFVRSGFHSQLNRLILNKHTFFAAKISLCALWSEVMTEKICKTGDRYLSQIYKDKIKVHVMKGDRL